MMKYKLQWIDTNGLHVVHSDDYYGMIYLHAVVQNRGIHVELWDMSLRNPALIAA